MKGGDDDVDRLDADEGQNQAAQAVDEKIAPEQGGRSDRPAEALRPVPPALIENLWSEAYRLDRLVVAGPA